MWGKQQQCMESFEHYGKLEGKLLGPSHSSRDRFAVVNNVRLEWVS
jgi:hypothetical protein